MWASKNDHPVLTFEGYERSNFRLISVLFDFRLKGVSVIFDLRLGGGAKIESRREICSVFVSGRERPFRPNIPAYSLLYTAIVDYCTPSRLHWGSSEDIGYTNHISRRLFFHVRGTSFLVLCLLFYKCICVSSVSNDMSCHSSLNKPVN